MYLVPVVQTLGSAIHRRDREVRLERVEINLVFKRIFEAIPHVCPRIAKSPLSSFSTGPRYKNIVQGTSYILGTRSLNSQGKSYSEIEKCLLQDA